MSEVGFAGTSPGLLQVPFSTLPKPERRHQPRRAQDQKRLILAKLAKWLMNCERRPHFIIDQNFSVLLINIEGKRLLASMQGITVRGAKLALANEKHRRALQQIVAGVEDEASFALGSAAENSILICTRRIPIVKAGAELFALTSSQEWLSDSVQIQRALMLSDAESAIAIGIYKGLSLVRIAKERRVSINTVKTQARGIFQKCGVRSQVELARHISELNILGNNVGQARQTSFTPQRVVGRSKL